MKTETKLWVPTYAIMLTIIVVGAILNWQKFITGDQFFILALGSMAAFNVFNAMMKLKEDTTLKRNRVILTAISLTIIGALIAVFFVIRLDLTYEFVFVLGIILASLLIPLVDWNAKRRIAESNSIYQNVL